MCHSSLFTIKGGSSGHQVLINALGQHHSRGNYGFQLPLLHDNDNGNESALPTIPPAPSNVLPSHPLLVRQPDTHSGGMTRVHRRGQRGTCRYNPSTQTLHFNLSRQPNPPVILQRLLGPTTAADVLQLTSTLTSVAGPTPTRVVLANDEPHFFSANNDPFEEFFQEEGGSYSGVLTNVPSTLTRWTEEAKVLDGDSVHDCITALKPDIIECLEQHRDEELKELREQKKKDNHSKENKKPDLSKMQAGWKTPPLASEAAAAAELIATAVVEDILHTSTPPSTTSQSAERIATAVVEDILQRSTPSSTAQSVVSSSGLGEDVTATPQVQGPFLTTPAATFLDPNQPLPVVLPPALRGNREGQRGSNLASLLMNDPASPSVPPQLSGETMAQILGLESISTGGESIVTGSDRHQGDGSITPEEVSGISSSDAVTIQSSGNFLLLNSVVDSMGLMHPNFMASFYSSPRVNFDSPASTAASAGPESPMTNYSWYRPQVEPESPSMPATSSTEGPDAPPRAPVVPGLESITLPTASSSNPPPPPAGGGGGPSSDLPEGVDPSFLAALPENIRQEVVAEQLRLQRIQQSAREQALTAQSTGTAEVSPEFLAALPPNIQEEVLAQQRTEQARLQAQQQSTSTPTDTPVDPASFLATLPSSLRQQVLADMDDSMVAVLPPDLAAEAQSLRRELEERHRRIMQERLFTQAGAGSLSSILRHTGFGGRLGAGRYSIRAVPRMPRRADGGWAFGPGRLGGTLGNSSQSAMKIRGRHLLDHEALTCLLVLLFVDEPKLNTTRLHRVLRNLCYHDPTRVWVIRALLSILQKTGECKLEESEKGKLGEKGKKKGQAMTSVDNNVTVKSDTKNQGTWLSISLEAALGCRANVFQIQRSGKKHTGGGSGAVTIHPQASPVVCRHVLDTLIALAKVFPSQFLPTNKVKEMDKCERTEEKSDSEKIKHGATSLSQCQNTTSSVSSPKASTSDTSLRTETDFWDVLVRLDSMSGKKGKSVQRTHNPNPEGEVNFYNYDSSPLGQLMMMLSHPVVKRSQLLTDRLLRLLGLVAIVLNDNKSVSRSAAYGASTASSLLSRSAIANNMANSLTVGAPAIASGLRSQGSSTAPAEPTTEKKEELQESKKSEESEESPILTDQLKLAVQAANKATRLAVLKLLLEGARVLGMTVCSHIKSLLRELRDYSSKIKDENDEDMKDIDMPSTSSGKGVLTDRYNPGSSVVVAAPKKIKVGRELQLPSMTLLTSKTSSQHFFLRILKVIIQLRDNMMSVEKSISRPADRDLSSITEAMAALEAEAEAIIDMVGQRAQHNHQLRQIQRLETGAPEPQQPPAQQPEPQQSTVQTTQGAVGVNNPTSTVSMSASVSLKMLMHLSEKLDLDDLWQVLGECLTELAKTPDHHAVLILQPAVEAFFIVHAGEKDGKPSEQTSQKREDQLSHLNPDMAPASPAASSSENPAPAIARENSVSSSVSSMSTVTSDTQKFLKFAETHRTVLNQILRQSTTPLSDGPFSVLVDHTRILDFDVKRRYFRQELERLDEGMRREDLAVHIRREHVFEDSFRELFRRSADEWKHRFYIVFEGEEGQDAGGLLREWYIIISREIFNPMYALFCISPGDRVTYTINPSSHCNSNHLSYFKFVGRIIAKAVYDNKLLECYFTRSFYKHIIGQAVKYTDMESEDYSFYQGLVFLLENNVEDLGYDLTFSTEIQEFGVTEVRDLKPDGRNIQVTEENKKEYVKLVCQMKMTGAIRQQIKAFMEGFYDIIPKRLISIFNEQELELLISGLPTIDIDDLKSNTEYHKYQPTSLQVQWFWRALRSFDQADRAQFLQFVTGTSKVPLQGFAFLEGMNGYQKFQIHRDDRSTDRLPVAHTCFNQLDLPAYETYDKLRHMLLLAINECSEGFGLA
ncbi:hypothetical protein FSP39_009035 [Pinctada imbricata]|uniref:HECT-type E3 ubiquitin transferase n=1 Tax=Pinctada imbricata TaxID=66713 RepID=A0AA88YN80_PINIB|nr:hypothetical protein FSP39_009035 [Pinctada imbricata]